MGLRIYSAKQWSAAKGIAETYATQSFDPFFESMVKAIMYDKTLFIRLVAVAFDEADQVHFEETLPYREAMLTGKANRR